MSHQHSAQQAVAATTPPLLTSLDALVDRLNAASGHCPNPQLEAQEQRGGHVHPPPIRVLLVGTNEGVGLTRSYGSSPAVSSTYLSEEVLSSVESAWATLPSSCPPHQVLSAAVASTSGGDSCTGGVVVPPHPLLSPLGMGGSVRTATAFYDNCILVHVHMSPLVVTIITMPNANIGSIKSTALPILSELLEPVRKSVLQSRSAAALASGVAPGGGQQSAGVGGAQIQMQQHTGMMQQQQMVGGGGPGIMYTDGGDGMMMGGNAGSDLDYFHGR